MAPLTNAEKILKLAEQAERLENLINPLGKFYKQFDYLNKFEHLNKTSELARIIRPAWLDNPAFTAVQRLVNLYQPPHGLANTTNGLLAFNRLAEAATLPPGLLQQAATLDLVQKGFFQNWNAAAQLAKQLQMPAKIEQLQARFGSLFAQLAEVSAEAHTEDEAIDTATLSADLLALGSEILATQRITADATGKLAAIAERYEQHMAAPADETTADEQNARDTLRVAQQGLRLQIISLIVTSLMGVLGILLTDYLSQLHDPAEQAATKRQFDDIQAQLASFATHEAAPIQAERIATRSVQVRASPRQTAEIVGQLRKQAVASVWATQGKWAQISFLDIDGLPTQGWVRRNSLGWPPGHKTKSSRR